MTDKTDKRRAARAAAEPHLPRGLAPRGLRKEEAAAYAGCETIRAFEAQMQRGLLPGAMPGTTQWDRKALDYAMDRLSGL